MLVIICAKYGKNPSQTVGWLDCICLTAHILQDLLAALHKYMYLIAAFNPLN